MDFTTSACGYYNNFRECSDRINALITDLANVKGVLNQVIDDAQTYGLLQ